MNIISFKKIDSTNTYVKSNIENIEDKTIISVDAQTQGHGRFGRVWVDLGAENIYMTFCLKPSEKIEPVYANLTQYLSVCLCKEFETFGLNPQIKWPNDVLVSNKKICGILAETVIKRGMLKGIALGIGINVKSSLPAVGAIDRPVTALNLEGVSISKNDLINSLAKRFFDGYEDFLKHGFKAIKSDYEKFSIPLGELNLAIFNKIECGNFAGFDDDGNLLLQKNDSVVKINMGEII